MYRRPLLLNLVDQLLYIIRLTHESFSRFLLVCSLLQFLFLHKVMVVWIPFRVVSEDEAGQVMNFIANPLTEVRIAQPTCAVLRGVHLFHDFD